MAQQEQQKASATPIPQKDKKNKRRQKASATATKKGQQDPSSVEQVGQSSSSNNNSNKPTPIPKSTNTSPKKRNRNAANKPSQPSNDNSNKTMYGEELPVPPTPRSSRISAKGKQKAIESNGNTGNMEDGEVDELDGLFFVDTAPGKLHKDILLPAERPVIAQRMRSVSPVEKSSSSASPSRSRSVSSVAQGDKVVPDYVGSSSEIKEANVITDDGVVEGSSKDLLNANTRQHSGGKSSSVADMEGQASRMPAVAQPSFEAASTNVSPGGAKRKRDDDAGKHINARTSGDAIMLLDDLSTDESDSSEEEPKRQRRQGEPILDDSHSEGESSGQDYGDAADNLALNVEPSVMRRPEPKSPQIAMQIDLTGSPPPADAESVTASAGGNRPITSLNGNLHDATTGDVSIADGSMVDANIDLEGVEDDEYQADRSRYFKEDDPLKVCARCGETGHTVRDCVHLQVCPRFLHLQMLDLEDLIH